MPKRFKLRTRSRNDLRCGNELATSCSSFSPSGEGFFSPVKNLRGSLNLVDAKVEMIDSLVVDPEFCTVAGRHRCECVDKEKNGLVAGGFST